MFVDYIFIMLLAAFVVIAALGFLADRWLRKKLKIPKREGILYKPVHPVQGWIEAFIVIGSIIILFNIEFKSIGPGVLMPFIFFLLFSFRAFMEWKFDRERREYILTALSVLFLIIVMPVMMFIYF